MLFNRRTQILVAGLDISDPPYLVEFNTEFDTDPEPNTGEVTLYNLSQNTSSQIKKGQQIIINSGYEGDVGTVALAVVSEVKTERNDLDVLTKIKIGDATDQWANASISKSYKAGIKASQVLGDILQGFGLEVGLLNLPKDIVYTGGKVVCGSLQAVVRQIVTDCGAKFHIANGRIIIAPESQGIQTAFILNSDTGLIGSPERVESEKGEIWKVRCLLNHQIGPDSIIKLESRDVQGWFRVMKGKHNSTKSEHVTEMEVTAV